MRRVVPPCPQRLRRGLGVRSLDRTAASYDAAPSAGNERVFGGRKRPGATTTRAAAGRTLGTGRSIDRQALHLAPGQGQPLAVLCFNVAEPVSINRKYKRGRIAAGKRGLYTSKEAAAFEQRIADAATQAKAECREWPRDPWQVVRTYLSLQLHNSGLDTDAARKLVRDALEGILYHRDQCVADGPSLWSQDDGGSKSIDVIVALYEVRSAAEARAKRTKFLADQLTRLRRKQKKANETVTIAQALRRMR